MNFSSLREIYLDWHLGILGHREPWYQDTLSFFSPRPRPPVVSNQRALRQLDKLPDLQKLKTLRDRQHRAKPRNEAEETLRLFCECGGPPLIRGLEVLVGLKEQLASLDSQEARAAFSQYGRLRDALLEIRVSHATWEQSIGDEAFFKKHPQTRDVRHEYLTCMATVLRVVAELTFPADFREYLDEMSLFLHRPDWREQFILDSQITYERSRARLTPGVLAPPHAFPKRFMPHGLTCLRPRIVYNTGPYGSLQVANELSFGETTDGPLYFNNVGSFNPRGQSLCGGNC